MGQNVIARLRPQASDTVIGIDKHAANLRVLHDLHPGVQAIHADLAERGPWQQLLHGADALVISHAQIGGLIQGEFTRNNIVATERLLETVSTSGGCHVVHISSSVVKSAAADWYTETKKAQEAIVLGSGNPAVVLRPTLMFGWFDRKHLGWLARFMQRVPVFPIPGSGRYVRQPLYAGDFSEIVLACLQKRVSGSSYNISGLEYIDYIDLMRAVREAMKTSTPIVKIPYSAFWLMLQIYGLVNRNPPFTTKQLEALVTPDIFEVIDWPALFDVRATPLREALHETFRDPRYASILLEF